MIDEEDLRDIGRSCAAKNMRKKGKKLIIDVEGISNCLKEEIEELL